MQQLWQPSVPRTQRRGKNEKGVSCHGIYQVKTQLTTCYLGASRGSTCSLGIGRTTLPYVPIRVGLQKAGWAKQATLSSLQLRPQGLPEDPKLLAGTSGLFWRTEWKKPFKGWK